MGEDLTDRRMHLQAPGVCPACGEDRPTEIFEDGGKLFGPMTTHLPWVDCPQCLEIAANEGRRTCTGCGRSFKPPHPDRPRPDLCRLCWQRVCFPGPGAGGGAGA